MPGALSCAPGVPSEAGDRPGRPCLIADLPWREVLRLSVGRPSATRNPKVFPPGGLLPVIHRLAEQPTGSTGRRQWGRAAFAGRDNGDASCRTVKRVRSMQNLSAQGLPRCVSPVRFRQKGNLSGRMCRTGRSRQAGHRHWLQQAWRSCPAEGAVCRQAACGRHSVNAFKLGQGTFMCEVS